MQQVNSIICSQTPANNDTVYFLIDDRINYTSNTKFSYRIKKLTDAYTDSNGKQQTGHCWMNQNLALQGDTTISKTMSNIKETTLKLSTSIPFSEYPNNGTPQLTYTSHIDNTADDITNNRNVGAHYSWCAAVATPIGDSCVGKYSAYENADQDICPANWRLPHIFEDSNRNSVEIARLVYLYSSNFKTIFNVAYTSRCRKGMGCPESTNTYYYWSATSEGSTSAFRVGGDTNNDYKDTASAYYDAMSLRCMAK